MSVIDVPHGTRGGYTGTRKRPGCRCDECRQGNAAYLRARVEGAEHGKLSTYTMGCRCDECRSAQSEYHRSYRDRPGYRAPQKQVQAWVNEQKAAPCMDCGGRFPSECMDFDHVRGQKDFNVSHVAKAVKNFDLLKAEIAKCDLVCANCHRTRTRSRRLEE